MEPFTTVDRANVNGEVDLPFTRLRKRPVATPSDEAAMSGEPAKMPAQNAAVHPEVEMGVNESG